MAAVVVTVDSAAALQALVAGKPKVVLGFHAPWHRTAGPLLASVASELAAEGLLAGDVAVASLDVAAHEDLAFEEEVALLPCFAFYRNGRRVRVLAEPDAGKALAACRAFAASMDEEEEEGGDNADANGNDGAKNGGGGDGGEGATKRPRLALVDRIERGRPLLLFVAGDRSKVGKSSVCLGLMGALLSLGFEPRDLAYIKPATQCESPQLVTKWCDAVGVANRGVGPVVFYKGFTREFLKGNVGTSADLLRDAREGVEEIGRGKKLVLVDGVGYPAVGSICGISNADIAEALGQAPVLLVGRPGVGDAVDSFNLNATFFRARGLRVLGAVFNRLPLEGFYSLEHCKEAVSQYFARFQPQTAAYGFLPELPALLAVREEMDQEHASQAQLEAAKEAQRMQTAALLVETFLSHVDLPRLLQDTYDHHYLHPQPQPPSHATASASAASAFTPLVAVPPPPPPAPAPPPASASAPAPEAAAEAAAGACAYVPGRNRNNKRKTREEIEAEARAQGAKKGG